MDKKQQRRYRLAQTILLRQNMTSREQIAHVFNRGGTIGIDGVGKRLAKLIEAALLLPDEEWREVFPRIPTGRATMPVEVPQGPGSRVEWQPAEGLLEGHSLSVPEVG